jgi:trans-2,3-dihydro-3-hydroxyanthranilate isomerase
MTSGMPFYTADVFTGEMFGGNQLAVFPAATGLVTRLMQAIAKELNLSETVFVFPPDDSTHTRKLRIFTPGSELPFAGHPTLGTAFVLASIGEVALDGASTQIVFEEGVGPISVTITAEGGCPAYCELTVARLPEFGPPPPPMNEIAAVLSLGPDEIRRDSFSPRGVSCGLPFFLVPLRDEGALTRARPDLSVWERSFSSWWAPHLYPFVEVTGGNGASIRARMFAPAMGIVEDPASGAAVAALAGYLAATRPPGNGTLRWVVDQGSEMGRPSRLHVECDREGDRITAVRVGGSAVMVAEGTLAVPSVTW